MNLKTSDVNLITMSKYWKEKKISERQRNEKEIIEIQGNENQSRGT